MSKHENNGDCKKCNEILDNYPGFYSPFRSWFKDLQKKNPETHCSDAGRGKLKQAEYKAVGRSKADYGQSSHNVNAGIDLFENAGDKSNIYEKKWFEEVVKPAVSKSKETHGISLVWYGMPGSSFYELPHVEVQNWRELLAEGKLKLVE